MADFPKSMKTLVKEKSGQSYEYKDVPVPHPNEGELLVKVHKVALCGTDIQKYKWNEGLFFLITSYIVGINLLMVVCCFVTINSGWIVVLLLINITCMQEHSLVQ